jgi:hypothetical protein
MNDSPIDYRRLCCKQDHLCDFQGFDQSAEGARSRYLCEYILLMANMFSKHLGIRKPGADAGSMYLLASQVLAGSAHHTDNGMFAGDIAERACHGFL